MLYQKEFKNIIRDEKTNRALLITSKDELESIISTIPVITEESDKEKNLKIHFRGEIIPLDICTNYMLISNQISGYNGFFSTIDETLTQEYKNNQTLYEKINDGLFNLVGIKKRGVIIPNPNPNSWYLPRLIMYTGNVDLYDEDLNETHKINTKKYIEDIILKINRE